MKQINIDYSDIRLTHKRNDFFMTIIAGASMCYNRMSGVIWVTSYASGYSLKEFASGISHETMHKVLHKYVNESACIAFDRIATTV